MNASLPGSAASPREALPAALIRLAPLFAPLGVLLVTSLLYLPSWESLLSMWNAFGSRFYTHGDLIAGLALLALWRRRGALAQAGQQPQPAGLAALLGLSAVWLLASQADITAVLQACLPLILLTTVYTVLGRETARLLRFPLLYLYAGIPIWEWIKEPLHGLTVAVMSLMLPLAGVPALIRGDVVHIPAGSFEIQSGCAGQAYLVVAVAIAVYLGDIRESPWRTRVWLIGLAAWLALIGNWVRVFVIIVAGQLTHMQAYIVRVSHDGFGWGVFAVVMAVFMGLAARLTRSPPQAAAVPADRLEGPDVSTGGLTAGAARMAALTWGLLAIAPVWSVLARQPPADAAPVALQQGLKGWAGPAPYHGTWRPVFAGTDARGLGVYAGPDGEAVLFVAEYLMQSDRAKLHAVGNGVWGEETPAIEREQRIERDGHALKELQVRDPDATRWLTWVTYDIGGHTTDSLASAQLSYAVRSLTGRPLSRVIALRVRCAPDCAAARTRAGAFLQANPWVLANPPMPDPAQVPSQPSDAALIPGARARRIGMTAAKSTE